MRHHVRFKPRAEKELRKLPKRGHDRILVAISALLDNPYVGKKLKGEEKAYYTLRVWPYRLIYLIYKKERIIIIMRIGHR